MSVRNLDKLFNPKSIAVIGASPRENTVGRTLIRNLFEGGFGGPIMPVNPKHGSVGGALCYPDIAALPVVPDLAVFATPPEPIPGMIDELGRRGTRAAIILTAGLARRKTPDGRTVRQAALEAAGAHGLRLMGPNCLGLIVPGVGLNASFAHVPAHPGKIAFVSQSGALCTAALDWARYNRIGFSHFISLGDSADVDFGDTLDYLAGDPNTRSILLYIESIRDARKFMSAARAAARNKPTLVIKAGRVPEGARAAASHTGALAGADDVYDAAIRRAGMLRVYTIDELFDAVETLARAKPVSGDRLAILTNGGGPGVICADELVLGGGRLAELGPDTLRKLDEVLPAGWSGANPVDIIGDATPERYRQSVEIMLRDPNFDALLVMQVPTALASSGESARAVIQAMQGSPANVLTSWLGRETVMDARRRFAEAGVPTYTTPDKAVRAFLHMVNYRKNQSALMETPASEPTEFTPDREAARAIISRALAEGRATLSEPEAKDLLAAYGVPVVRTRAAADANEAADLADEIGYPVALKILSPDISHKTDVGGVALNLENRAATLAAAEAMLARVAKSRPEARVTGFSVQAMARRPGAVELIVGAATDDVFGPVILFGQGGIAVEVLADRAIGLPPLNMSLAGDLISRTRVSRLLAGFRGGPPADHEAIKLTLMRVSQLVIDFAEVRELDINPLFADAAGVLALDARVSVQATAQTGQERLAIRPYPRELEEKLSLPCGLNVLVRPIRPEDEPAHQEFFTHLESQDIRFRFFGMVREMSHSEMARFTQIDYDREIAFVAIEEDGEGRRGRTLGEVRAVSDPDNIRAEFAIIVRSDLKGKGLGRALMEKLIRYLRARGLREITGEILSDNKAMLRLAEAVGFVRLSQKTDVVQVRCPLRDESVRVSAPDA